MKPHRLSDLLSDLYRRINPAYGPGRQKGEFAEALAAVGICPEHGNRGEELEALVLVDAKELARLRSASTLPPEITDSEWRKMFVEVAREMESPIMIDVEEDDVCDQDVEMVRRMEKRYRGILSESRILKDGERAVPVAYLEALQSAANRFCSSCRDNNSTCTMTARHFGGTGCGAWKLDGARINALRSGEAEGRMG